MFKGSNKLIVNAETLNAVMQEYINDRLFAGHHVKVTECFLDPDEDVIAFLFEPEVKAKSK